MKKAVGPLIHLFNKYLLSTCYMRPTALSEGDTIVSKSKPHPCLAELALPGESDANEGAMLQV